MTIIVKRYEELGSRFVVVVVGAVREKRKKENDTTLRECLVFE